MLFMFAFISGQWICKISTTTKCALHELAVSFYLSLTTIGFEPLIPPLFIDALLFLPSQGITGLQVLQIHLKHGNRKTFHVFLNKTWVYCFLLD
jgi:hypothetical protein